MLRFDEIDSVPIVEAVMDERRPKTHENGRDKAIAPVPKFPTFIQQVY